MKKTLLLLLTATLSAVAALAQQPLKLWYNRPAAFFEESLPLGNGRLGALVYGGSATDSIYLNDITLWTGKPVNRWQDSTAWHHLASVRQALFAEDYALADSLQRQLQGNNSQFYQPLGLLLLRDATSGAVSHYRRSLDLNRSMATVSYQRNGITYTKQYIATHPDRAIAVHLKASSRKALNFEVALTSLLPHHTEASEAYLTMNGHATGADTSSIHFSTIVKVNAKGGTVEANDSTLHITGATEATLYLVNATSFNGFDKHPVKEGKEYMAEAMEAIANLDNTPFKKVQQRHEADYTRFFNRVSFELDGALYNADVPTDQVLRHYTGTTAADRYLEQLYFQFGRYLLVSSSRTEGVPANLQGLWAPDLWSPWRGNYTVNINLEENYWPAEVTALPEMTQPLNGFIKALASTGQYTAQSYYGIRNGWCSSHNSDIWAMSNPTGEKRESPEWANWNMGGAWLVNTLWEHYLFTQDTTYLRQTAYPLMQGAARFCLDWLIENPKKPGELITAPATSPENEYITDKGYHGTTAYGATADLAIMRELFAHTAAAARLLHTDGALADSLDRAVARMAPYKIGKKGNLQEWYYNWKDYDPHHRHQSHLIGLYPGSHITPQLTPELAKACATTLRIKGDVSTGWSTGWRINLWARLGDGNHAYNIYKQLLSYVSPEKYRGADKRHGGGTYPNLFDAHPPFQIDGNFGGTAGVAEMLLQSHNNRLKPLPALPDAGRKGGQINVLRARGGYVVNLAWKDGKLTRYEVKDLHGNPVNAKP